MYSHIAYFSKPFTRTSLFYNFAPQSRKFHFGLRNSSNLDTPLSTTFQLANDPTSLSIASKFIVPDENKPNFTNIYHLHSIPIIDMNKDNEVVVDELSRACEAYGFFQLINHGVPKELYGNVLENITNFFNLPSEEKTHLLSTKHMDDGKLCNYYMRDEKTMEKIYMWGQAFYHTWHPVDASFIQKLPSNPPSYREVIPAYIKEIASLISRLLSLISQTLGLDKEYLQRRLGENPQRTAQANFYPPCPNPDHTLGLRDHTDLKILTVLVVDEGVPGLQVLKDDKWFAVDPKPGALIINVADQLQVLSNDKYKSARHRVVNNMTNKRASFAIFVGLDENGTVDPIEELVNKDNPALYRNYSVYEFNQAFCNQERKNNS